MQRLGPRYNSKTNQNSIPSVVFQVVFLNLGGHGREPSANVVQQRKYELFIEEAVEAALDLPTQPGISRVTRFRQSDGRDTVASSEPDSASEPAPRSNGERRTKDGLAVG